MKKLEKQFRKRRNTIETYGACDCAKSCCPCSFCAATWSAQYNSDLNRNLNTNYTVLHNYFN